MESAAENSRGLERRTPVVRPQTGSWGSRIAFVGTMILLGLVALSVPTQYARWYLAQAEALEKVGKNEQAIASLDEAIKWIPKLPGIYIHKARLYGKMGNPKAVEENLRLALPLLDSSPAELAQFADIAAKGELVDLVVESCEKIDSLVPSQPMAAQRELLNASAYARAQVDRDCETGLNRIDRALSLPEGMPSYAVGGTQRAAYEDTRALLLYRLGRNDEALVEINTAIRRVEEDFTRTTGRVVPIVDASTVSSVDKALAGAAAPRNEKSLADAAQKTPNLAEAATANLEVNGKRGPYEGYSKINLLTWGVMLNHRAMIQEALGDKAGAEADRARITHMGMAPGDDLH